jgi:alpha-L-fucosidase 2
MGAMVFGARRSAASRFNEHTVWTGFPRSYAHTNALLPCRDPPLLFAGKQRGSRRAAMRDFMSVPLRQRNISRAATCLGA